MREVIYVEFHVNGKTPTVMEVQSRDPRLLLSSGPSNAYAFSFYSIFETKEGSVVCRSEPKNRSPKYFFGGPSASFESIEEFQAGCRDYGQDWRKCLQGYGIDPDSVQHVITCRFRDSNRIFPIEKGDVVLSVKNDLPTSVKAEPFLF